MWALLILLLGLAGLGWWWGVVAAEERRNAAKRRRMRSRTAVDSSVGPISDGGDVGTERARHAGAGVERYQVPVDAGRVPLRDPDDADAARHSGGGSDWDDDDVLLPPSPPVTTSRLLDELRAELNRDDADGAEGGRGGGGGGGGRVVMTSEGPVAWSEPPFRAAGVLFEGREARVLSALSGRLPGGFVLAAGVRLDAMLEPVRPSDGSFETWRTWRERVRRRSVSGVICHAGSWRPVLCVLVVEPVKATELGGGRDRITTEALQAAGVPFVEVEGELDADWGRIDAALKRERVTRGLDERDEAETAGGLLRIGRERADGRGNSSGGGGGGGTGGGGGRTVAGISGATQIPPESAGVMFSMLDDDDAVPAHKPAVNGDGEHGADGGKRGKGGGGGAGAGDRFAERRA